jgi:hypothetical protein
MIEAGKPTTAFAPQRAGGYSLTNLLQYGAP